MKSQKERNREKSYNSGSFLTSTQLTNHSVKRVWMLNHLFWKVTETALQSSPNLASERCESKRFPKLFNHPTSTSDWVYWPLQTEGSGIMACCDPSLHPVSTTGTGCFKVYINCSHSFSVVKSLNITIISVKTGFNTLKLSFIKSCRSSLRLCSPLQLFTSSPKQLLWNQANLATCENHGCYVTFHSSLNALKGDHVNN